VLVNTSRKACINGVKKAANAIVINVRWNTMKENPATMTCCVAEFASKRETIRPSKGALYVSVKQVLELITSCQVLRDRIPIQKSNQVLNVLIHETVVMAPLNPHSGCFKGVEVVERLVSSMLARKPPTRVRILGVAIVTG